LVLKKSRARVKLQGFTAKNKQIAGKPAPAPANVVDLVKVLQESINRSQSGRVKRGGNGASGRQRSAPTLVKQKRRAAA